MIKIERPDCPNTKALRTNYKHVDNKSALINANHKKCMYCECYITHTYAGDIEHIKPKSLFPDLEFDWNNLGLACWKCNNIKKDKFDQNTEYINPYKEEPSDYLVAFGWILRPKQGSERGELTILDIELNRIDLIERRIEKLNNIEKAMQACNRNSNSKLKAIYLEELKNESNSDKEFSMFAKGLLETNRVL